MELFVKYLDRDLLIIKNIRVEEIGGRGKGKSKNKKSMAGNVMSTEQKPKQNGVQNCDPVTKLQILFYLETTWR